MAYIFSKQAKTTIDLICNLSYQSDANIIGVVNNNNQRELIIAIDLYHKQSDVCDVTMMQYIYFCLLVKLWIYCFGVGSNFFGCTR